MQHIYTQLNPLKKQKKTQNSSQSLIQPSKEKSKDLDLDELAKKIAGSLASEIAA